MDRVDRATQGTACLLSAVYPPQHGGSGRWFREIYRRILPTPVIVAGRAPRDCGIDREHTARVHRTDFVPANAGLSRPRSIFGLLRNLRELSAVVKRSDAKSLHAGCVLPEGFLAYLLRWTNRTPYLVYVHGEEVEGAALGRELNWMARRVFRNASLVIANCENTREIMLRDWRMPAEKLAVLHPGVDTRRFTPAARDVETRTALGWGDRPVVLTVGRLQERKGHDRMIEALPGVRERVPDVLYAIVGDGERRPVLEQLAKDCGVADHVRFHGALDDEAMIRCYQQCDLFVLSNRRVGTDIEGFGMVLLEAQSCGKPVVAGDSGGTAETMRVGETGLIADCTRPEPLAEAVAGLLCDPGRRAAMGLAARQWTVSQFEWDALARQAEALFATVGRERSVAERSGVGR